MATAKVSCSCKHEWQDKEHGKGVRVANARPPVKDRSDIEVRCTVCKTLHRIPKTQLR